jgi:predicted CopG family antitoxin
MVKTITIDMEAYTVLSRYKRAGQSFSEVIKEQLGPIRTGRQLLAALKGVSVGDQTLAALDDVVRSRRRDRPRRVTL